MRFPHSCYFGAWAFKDYLPYSVKSLGFLTRWHARSLSFVQVLSIARGRFSCSIPERAIDDVLFYCEWYIGKRWEMIRKHSERSRLFASSSDTTPDFPSLAPPASNSVLFDGSSLLPLEALVRVAEVAASCVFLGLAGFCYMPENLVDIVEGPSIVSLRKTPVQRSMQHWATKVKFDTCRTGSRPL